MNIRRTASAALMFVALSVCDVHAADTTPLIPLSDLFGNPVKISSNVSPDGKWVSWLAPVNGVLNLWVAPIDHLETAQPVTRDAARGIGPGTNAWASDGRHLLYLQDQGGNGNVHLYAVNLADRTTKDLTPFEGVRAGVVSVSPKIRGEILITLNRRDPNYGDLYRVNLETGTLSLVAQNPGFTTFLVDQQFFPKLAVKVEATGALTIHRWDNGVWNPWLVVPREDSRSTSLLNIDAAAKTVFALDSRGRDTTALVKIDLASGTETVIADDPRADIRDVIFDQTTHEPVAYAVMVARLEHKALTPKVQHDLNFLETQDLGDWTLNTQSEDDRYWKMTMLTDRVFGAALYDRKTGKVTKLYNTRPALEAAPLVPMHALTIKSRDGLDLVSYLSLPKDSDKKRNGFPDTPLPLVLVVHGGPHNRDVYGFNPIHQWLANRGYAVLSVNMRGSTGFGKSFTNASVAEWGAKLDDDLMDAVGWAVQNGIADPARIAIMGGSYGGYATLAGLTRDPDTYACGIDSFGPTDLVTLNQAAFLAASPLYHDEYDLKSEMGLAVAREQSPLFHVDRIKAPVLVAQGANDPGVTRDQSDRMVAAIKARGITVTYLLFPDEGHGFLRAANNLAFTAIAEQFLGKCLGRPTEPLTPEALKASSLQVIEGLDYVEGLRTTLVMQDGSATSLR